MLSLLQVARDKNVAKNTHVATEMKQALPSASEFTAFISIIKPKKYKIVKTIRLKMLQGFCQRGSLDVSVYYILLGLFAWLEGIVFLSLPGSFKIIQGGKPWLET